MTLRDAARRLPWVLLLAAWALLGWLWVWGPTVLPYVPATVEDPPDRPVSICAAGVSRPLVWYPRASRRRSLVIHPTDREAWEMLHGPWDGSTRLFPPGPPVTHEFLTPLAGVELYVARRLSGRRAVRCDIDLLYAAGFLAVWTGLLLASAALTAAGRVAGGVRAGLAGIGPLAKNGGVGRNLRTSSGTSSGCAEPWRCRSCWAAGS